MSRNTYVDVDGMDLTQTLRQTALTWEDPTIEMIFEIRGQHVVIFDYHVFATWSGARWLASVDSELQYLSCDMCFSEEIEWIMIDFVLMKTNVFLAFIWCGTAPESERRLHQWLHGLPMADARLAKWVRKMRRKCAHSSFNCINIQQILCWIRLQRAVRRSVKSYFPPQGPGDLVRPWHSICALENLIDRILNGVSIVWLLPYRFRRLGGVRSSGETVKSASPVNRWQAVKSCNVVGI